jgi:hypothetical protein
MRRSTVLSLPPQLVFPGQTQHNVLSVYSLVMLYTIMLSIVMSFGICHYAERHYTEYHFTKCNETAQFKKCKQLFEYQHLLLL